MEPRAVYSMKITLLDKTITRNEGWTIRFVYFCVQSNKHWMKITLRRWHGSFFTRPFSVRSQSVNKKNKKEKVDLRSQKLLPTVNYQGYEQSVFTKTPESPIISATSHSSYTHGCNVRAHKRSFSLNNPPIYWKGLGGCNSHEDKLQMPYFSPHF